MTMPEMSDSLKLFGKMPSGITLAGLIGVMIWGIWNGAKLQDQVTANSENIKLEQVRFEALEKIVNVNNATVERLSYRMTAGDDRATALTTSVGTLAAEIHQIAVSMAQVQVLLQNRLPQRLEERKP